MRRAKFKGKSTTSIKSFKINGIIFQCSIYQILKSLKCSVARCIFSIYTTISSNSPLSIIPIERYKRAVHLLSCYCSFPIYLCRVLFTDIKEFIKCYSYYFPSFFFKYYSTRFIAYRFIKVRYSLSILEKDKITLFFYYKRIRRVRKFFFPILIFLYKIL